MSLELRVLFLQNGAENREDIIKMTERCHMAKTEMASSRSKTAEYTGRQPIQSLSENSKKKNVDKPKAQIKNIQQAFGTTTKNKAPDTMGNILCNHCRTFTYYMNDCRRKPALSHAACFAKGKSDHASSVITKMKVVDHL